MDDKQITDTKDVQAQQKKMAEQLILDRLNRLYGQGDQGSANNQIVSQADSKNNPIQQKDTEAESSLEQDSKQSIAQEQPTSQEIDQTSLYNHNYQELQTSQTISQDWQQYHSAWQDYYQKYYEYYYAKNFQEQAKSFQQNLDQEAINPQDSALEELRQKVRNSMVETATKARRSQHFWPIASALLVGLIFIFLQYNRLLIANAKAYITPAEEIPAIVVTNPNIAIDVGPDPWLTIPKINVKAPVVYYAKNNEASQQKAMQKGVSHFRIPGASSYPGQIGNVVLNGHSSNDVFDKGDYKFIFTKLDRLAKDDIIYVDFEGTRYTYSVIKSEVIWPKQVDKLRQKYDKPTLILITCTPVGTSRQRLIVTAEQISPDYTKSTKATDPGIVSKKSTPIPGNSKTFFEKIGDLFR